MVVHVFVWLCVFVCECVCLCACVRLYAFECLNRFAYVCVCL